MPEPVDEQSSDEEDGAGAAELEETAAPLPSTEDDAPAAEDPAEAPADEKV